jgi:hypothetical protein
MQQSFQLEVALRMFLLRCPVRVLVALCFLMLFPLLLVIDLTHYEVFL